ncbi:gluconate:H+ symporter, GntP family [Quadrisphaera granulorum]|uniref:GntP family gluconate:H+ symporter n=1 Tax=Quadrisphaera granulorum TaxID=317664 RepID=A0A316AHQ8_9ACTN|nr:gluconate:H+ symporter [Quadrisphaera granulorum]PWJ56484.1 GntP family gluconate:H+ symporter [Quadrisphaera granulorum]SZE95118.1 gluconate:H+ symporter, GntP family [Quadrisphaera granulorum]
MVPVLSAATSTTAGEGQLIVAAVVGIIAIVLLITWLKLHPFLALVLGSALLAVVAGVPLSDTFTSFSTGLGSTIGGVGVLIALGAIIGKLLIDSGGADAIVDTVIAKTPSERLPWAMALIAFVIGIPLFFEVGVVLLIPVVMLVARRTRRPVILLGIPALAGLSALHGLVPPHPGPLIAVDALKADLGLTLGLGLLVAIPTVIIAGPILARPMARWVPLEAPALLVSTGAGGSGGSGHTATGAAGDAAQGTQDGARRPSFLAAVTVVLLPVVLMLLRAVVELVPGSEDTLLRTVTDLLGAPLVALLVSALAALVILGTGTGRDRATLSRLVDSSFVSIASILLIVGAGGGFKQTLVDSGVGQVIGNAMAGAPVSPLIAAWVMAVFIRLATGSATVATVTAAGLAAPLAAGLDAPEVALMVLAIGAGSVFLSHVNDAGFWLIKEYFGMTIGQTFKTWSLMECVVSVVGLVCVLLLDLVV